MSIMSRIATTALLSFILLAGCTTQESSVRSDGPVSAVISLHDIVKESVMNNRPSAALGLYTGMFLAQGNFVSARSATLGIEAQTRILAGQEDMTSDETFALLQEIGNVLQVDIIDILNRSNNREQTLNAYLQSLKNMGILAERKISELKVQVEALQDQRSAKRTVARNLERDIKTALRNEDYVTAGELQPDFTEAEGTLAVTETKLKQTDDIMDRLTDLLDIIARRVNAIAQNKQVLIAGNRVIDVPGIEDLNILVEGEDWRRSNNRGSGIFGN